MDLQHPSPPEPKAAAVGAGILAEMTAGLAAGRDLHELLQRFLEPVVLLSGAQAGAVRVLDDPGRQLVLLGEVGMPPGLCRAGREVDRHCGHCGAALDRTEVVGAVALDTCADALHPVAPGWRLWVVPLQHRGRTLGVYNLFFAAGAAPAPHVQGLLRSVGELLGLALHNARLEAENLRASLAAERQAMAAELHDSVAQALTFVKMRLPLLRDALIAHDDERSLAYFDDVRSTVGEAHAALRGLLTHYRSVGDPLGLDHALAASASAFRRQSDAELVVDNRLPALRLSADQELQVCRIVQEALANVARHAAARHARLHLGAAGAEEVEVVVEDDGAGLAARHAAEGGHHGLAIMSERARRIGGRLEVVPREGGGTRVRLTFPAVSQGVA